MNTEDYKITRSAKSVYAKSKIKELSRDFGGTMSDPELIKHIKICRNSFYKYKRELRSELERELYK